MNKETIFTIVVTYGNREHFLLKTIKALLNQTFLIDKIIVVNNASNLNLNEPLLKSDKISILNNNQNLGSAIGYKKGIQLACIENADLIWLVDDDNIAEKDALEKLINFNKGNLLNSQIAVSSFRTSRKKYYDLFHTNINGLKIEKKNLFFGLEFAKIIKKRIHPLDHLQVDYVTYGGFLFSSKSVEIVGLPDENYFLYMDDREYTYRFTNNGIKIFVLRSSKLDDIDNSWNSGNYFKLPVYFIPETSKIKIFYSFRNKIRFDLKHIVTSKFLYKYSVYFYIGFGCIMALFNKIPIKIIKVRSKLLISILKKEFININKK